MKELLESVPSCCWFGMALIFTLFLFMKVNVDAALNMKDRNE